MSKDRRFHSSLHYLFRIPIQIASNFSTPSDLKDNIQSYLKFQNPEQAKHYEACINILEDTDAAIVNAFRFQLCDMRYDVRSYSDMYLRLYGILDACYMQCRAYRRLRVLLNHPKRSQKPDQFEKLKMIQMRHKAGAHSMDFNGSESYRLIQHHLCSEGKKICIVDSSDHWEEYNLMDCLIEFEAFTRQVLIDLLHHLRITIIRKKEDKEWFDLRMKEVIDDLVVYSELDENKTFWTNHLKKLKPDLD